MSAGGTSPGDSPGGSIAKAPNFSADDLSALPTDNWPTVGGNLMNERYSPLTQIDTSNVSQLKGVWRTHLDGSGVGAKYSAESQPVVYKGVIYVTTGEDDAFAVSVATGKILWTYSSGISQKISTVCCGWLNRGVAIGDGRVYMGQLDGKVVALDQQTGKLVWSKQLVKWQLGQTITAAPIYVDHKIYIGVVGAEYGTRSFLEAMDASTGKQAWRWYTTAAPGEPGGDTWPSGSKQYLRGGATIWQAPAVDPKLGLLYFSTGNAGSDWFGGDRPGKNLYAASIVALDLKTGKLKWYFQQVHHDIWDFDSASPVVLFDAGGRQGIAQASKTGWLYMLDRATGKPLYGIPEKPVPQNAAQKSWPTQPIPANSAFTPHGTPPAGDVKRVKKEAVGPLAKVPVVIAHAPFTPPPPKKLLIYGNGPQGGVNWQPVSYNEKTHMIYVCSSVSWVGFEAGRTKFVRPGVTYNGALGAAGVAWPEASGTFTAIDARKRRRQVAEALPRAVLRRHRDDRGQPRLRRPQLRRAAGVQRDRRQAAVELPDRRGRERHGDDLPAGRQGVRRLPLRRQLARRDAARRQPLALRARRQARPGADARQGSGHAARGREDAEEDVDGRRRRSRRQDRLRR